MKAPTRHRLTGPSAPLVGLRPCLRAAGQTYATAAAHLGLCEASVRSYRSRGAPDWVLRRLTVWLALPGGSSRPLFVSVASSPQGTPDGVVTHRAPSSDTAPCVEGRDTDAPTLPAEYADALRTPGDDLIPDPTHEEVPIAHTTAQTDTGEAVGGGYGDTSTSRSPIVATCEGAPFAGGADATVAGTPGDMTTVAPAATRELVQRMGGGGNGKGTANADLGDAHGGLRRTADTAARHRARATERARVHPVRGDATGDLASAEHAPAGRDHAAHRAQDAAGTARPRGTAAGRVNRPLWSEGDSAHEPLEVA